MRRSMPLVSRRSAGFTLIEAIMVIVITGVLAGMVAVFLKSPIDSYFDMARRAELTDMADTAVRRIARDIRLSLPNSVRNPSGGSDQCIEFMPTKIGGRYRAAQTATGTGNILDFTTTDSSFDMLWLNSALPAADQIAANDIVVVYNDGYAGNAYTGSNAVKVSGVAEPGGTANTTAVTLVATGVGTPFNGKAFPAESPSYRFQIIPSTEHVVAYVCSGVGTSAGNGTGVLWRYSHTLSAAWSQPATCAAMISGATAARLADNLTSCSLIYQPPGSGTGAGRYGIVSISLEMMQSNESVRLYHQVHVDNTP